MGIDMGNANCVLYFLCEKDGVRIINLWTNN